jgi:hypothetical protein
MKWLMATQKKQHKARIPPRPTHSPRLSRQTQYPYGSESRMGASMGKGEEWEGHEADTTDPNKEGSRVLARPKKSVDLDHDANAIEHHRPEPVPLENQEGRLTTLCLRRGTTDPKARTA